MGFWGITTQTLLACHKYDAFSPEPDRKQVVTIMSPIVKSEVEVIVSKDGAIKIE